MRPPLLSDFFIKRPHKIPPDDFYYIKYDKQDQQGKAAFNERNPHMNQRQGAQADPEQKQDRAKTEHGQANH
jgi:hypothetical protein